MDFLRHRNFLLAISAIIVVNCSADGRFLASAISSKQDAEQDSAVSDMDERAPADEKDSGDVQKADSDALNPQDDEATSPPSMTTGAYLSETTCIEIAQPDGVDYFVYACRIQDKKTGNKVTPPELAWQVHDKDGVALADNKGVRVTLIPQPEAESWHILVSIEGLPLEAKPTISFVASYKEDDKPVMSQQTTADLSPTLADSSIVPQNIIFDDFSSANLDPQLWLVAQTNWTGGGLVTDNVEYYAGIGEVHLSSRGDLYTGPVVGINKDGTPRADGKRSSGAIALKEYIGSGRYEVRVKMQAQIGANTGIWTSHYQEYLPGDPLFKENPEGGSEYFPLYQINAFTFPAKSASSSNYSLARATLKNSVGPFAADMTLSGYDLPASINDGNFHVLRMDWHTGDDQSPAKVEYYIDGKLAGTHTTNVPLNKSRFWIGATVPDAGWAGDPQFETSKMIVDWVRITPFLEANDQAPMESYPDSGWGDISKIRTASP